MSKIKTIKIYDLALCCSTGVCGVEPDQQLLTFAADVEWLKKQGIEVERFNLAQQPMAYATNDKVKEQLQKSGMQALPLIIADEQIVLSGRYPNRMEMEMWMTLGPVTFQGAAGSCCCG